MRIIGWTGLLPEIFSAIGGISPRYYIGNVWFKRYTAARFFTHSVIQFAYAPVSHIGTDDTAFRIKFIPIVPWIHPSRASTLGYT